MSHEEDAVNYISGPARVIYHSSSTCCATLVVSTLVFGIPSPSIRTSEGAPSQDLLEYYKKCVAELEVLLGKETPKIMTQEKLRRVIEDLP